MPYVIRLTRDGDAGIGHAEVRETLAGLGEVSEQGPRRWTCVMGQIRARVELPEEDPAAAVRLRIGWRNDDQFRASLRFVLAAAERLGARAHDVNAGRDLAAADLAAREGGFAPAAAPRRRWWWPFG